MKKNLYIFTTKDPKFWWWVEKVSREIWRWFYKTWNFNVNFVFPWDKSKTENNNWINYITVKNTLKIPFFNEIILNTKLTKLFKKLKNNDIVINNWFSPIPYLLFNKKHFKLVHICHWTLYWSSCSVKNWGLSFFKKWLNIIYARSLDILVKPILKRADLVVTLSKYLKDELINHYKIDTDKIAIIYNWCDSVDDKLKPSHNGSTLKVAFIWSEYGGKWLNILEWIAKDMASENINFKVIWTKSYTPMSKNIKSLWRLKRDDVYKNMSESDVIFLPSHYEWQPLVLLEWMSFWCIPVCSKACHMDMLEPTEFNKFISNENSIDDYISIFKSLLKSGNIGNLRSQSKDIVSKLTRDNQIKQYINLIDNL